MREQVARSDALVEGPQLASGDDDAAADQQRVDERARPEHERGDRVLDPRMVDPVEPPQRDVGELARLELGTIHGARCLGREAEIGSLEPGKNADIALWRLDGVDHAGIEDPVAALVLGPRPLVDTLLVGGRVVVSGGELRTFDEGVAARDLLAQSRRLASRAGVAA